MTDAFIYQLSDGVMEAASPRFPNKLLKGKISAGRFVAGDKTRVIIDGIVMYIIYLNFCASIYRAVTINIS